MTLARKILLGVAGWLGAVTLLHLWLNTDVLDPGAGQQGRAGERFRVGFLPVT